MPAERADQPLRFVVVGCGSIGARHIRNLLALQAGEVLAYDVEATRLPPVLLQGPVRAVSTLREAWAQHPQVAIIAAPTSLHVPLALEAAEHGCHLLIEKPLWDRQDAALDRLLDVVRAQKLATLVGCNLRFHPALRQVKRWCEEGAVGRIIAARVALGHYLPDWHPTEDYRRGYSARTDLGGGVTLDAIHELDYIRWLVGEVGAVSSFMGKLSSLDIDTEDTAGILLRFINGAIGEVHLDYVQRAYSRTCQIIGEAGTICWDYAAGEARCYTAATRAWQRYANPKGWEPNQMYVDELRHFLRCVRGEEPSALDLVEAARVLTIALAAKTAAQTNQVIPMPPGGASAPRKTVAIIQARMGSTRLPGKVLASIAGRPMLWHIVERIRQVSLIHQVVVATSTASRDDAIAQFCAQHDLACFRGSETDVLDRFYQAATRYHAGVVARITADCPLIDPDTIQRVVEAHLKGGYDYVTNALHHTYPDGLDAEVFSFEALEAAWKEASLPAEREHVTAYFRRAAGQFRLGNVDGPKDRSMRAMRWTVDEPADLDFVRAVYERLGGGQQPFGMREVLGLLKAHPELCSVNAGPPRNEGYYRSLVSEPAVREQPRALRRSCELKTRAARVIPSGTQTFSKGPDQFVQGVAPVYLARGSGSHVWDVDGNEYIDYPMALGPIILGHNYPAVTEAVRRQMEDGTLFSLPHPLEVEVAELLAEIIPCAEMARFAKNGSDATAGAVRAVRAYTGRDMIACCGYHGWQDWFIGTTTRQRGVPEAVRRLTVAFEYNDLEGLKRIFAEYPRQIAAVIMEPVGVVEPQAQFLEQVRALTQREGALLIFDEVVTGCRLALGGAQEYFGVTPDLACVGKGIANGYPLAAVVGRRDIMAVFDEVFFSFTFGGEALSLAAAKATITELRRQDVITALWATGEQLRDGYNAFAKAYDISRWTACMGYPPRTVMVFRDEDGAESLIGKSVFQQECLKRGVLFSGAQNVCFTHSAEDIEQTLRVYRTAMEILADAIRSGNLMRRLEGEPVQPVFRRP